MLVTKSNVVDIIGSLFILYSLNLIPLLVFSIFVIFPDIESIIFNADVVILVILFVLSLITTPFVSGSEEILVSFKKIVLPDKYKSFHLFDIEPKLYSTSIDGIISPLIFKLLFIVVNPLTIILLVDIELYISYFVA